MSRTARKPWVLTEREAFVLRRVALGYTHLAIGRAMEKEFGLTPTISTGKYYSHCLLQKFNATNAPELVATAFRFGFLFWKHHKLYVSMRETEGPHRA